MVLADIHPPKITQITPSLKRGAVAELGLNSTRSTRCERWVVSDEMRAAVGFKPRVYLGCGESQAVEEPEGTFVDLLGLVIGRFSSSIFAVYRYSDFETLRRSQPSALSNKWARERCRFGTS